MKSYKLGTVEDLYISKHDVKDRLNQSEIVLDEDGVFIDKFYGKDKARSVLITSVFSYEKSLNEKIKISSGQLGENILVDFPLNKLNIGDQLDIGEVTLQITQNCTMCTHLSDIDERLPELLQEDRGIFAKVLKGGIIKTEDIVYNIGNANG